METQTQKPLAQLYAALAKAQGEYSPIPKNRTVKIATKSGGSYVFSYADLETMIAATRPALSKNGLAVIQPIVGNKLVTTICHESGEYIESSMSLPDPMVQDPKYYGALVTYFRRYAYQALVCVSADDDLDQEGAQDVQPAKPNQQPQQPAREEKRDERPAYLPERFKADYPIWEKSILNGKKTNQGVIDHIQSKYTMTEAQKQAIMAIKAAAPQGEQQ